MIITGNVLDALPTLPSGSVQCCVTSPPYWGLRDYGVAGQLGSEPTIEEYVAIMVAVFREVRRTLRDDGTLWLNLGDSYNGSGGAGGDYGPGGLKEGQPKYAGHDDTGLKPKDMCGIPWRVAFALQADGWWLRSDIIWAKPNPMPESVTDRPTKSHEYIFLLTKSARYYYDSEAVKEPATATQLGATGIPFGGIKQTNGNDNPTYSGNEYISTGTRNLRDVWTISTQSYPEAHFATFPETIPERCIRAGTKGGDTVLDPFMGSGTTCAVAKSLGRDYIGIELNPAYVQLAEKRIANAQPPLFGL
jgi:DNA modification methylase